MHSFIRVSLQVELSEMCRATALYKVFGDEVSEIYPLPFGGGGNLFLLAAGAIYAVILFFYH